MINKIMDTMKSINYGYLDIRGIVHNEVDDDFANIYKLETPDEVLKNKVGVCWDQVELERYLFSKEDIEFKTYFIIHYDNDKCPTHTFLIYKDKDKYCWFEHAFEKYSGIKSYNSEIEAINDVKNKFICDELDNNYEDDNLCIYEYSKPKYELSVLEFINHCESGKIINLN